MSVTITKEEYGRLRAIKEIHYQAFTAQAYYAALADASEVYFEGNAGDFALPIEAWPDWLFLREFHRHCIGSAIFQEIEVGPGEENNMGVPYEDCFVDHIYNGHVVYREWKSSQYAELHPISQGTLIGKILLELAGRLEKELRKDARMEAAAPWEPPLELPDDPPAPQ